MHRVPAFVLLASIAACASSTPTAPSRVAAENGSIVARAGDPVVDGSFLVPYENRWKITVTLADGRPRDAGTWTDRLERVTVDARPMLRRTQRESELVTDEDVHPGLAAKIGGDRLEVTRINVFDPKTVAPVTSELLTNVKRGSRAQFSGGRVRVEKSIGDAPPIVVDEDLADAPFDYFGGMFGLLFATLPLREGLSAKLAAYRPEPGDAHGRLQWVEARVVRRERVAAGPLGERDTWLVESRGDRSGSLSFWLSKEPPYVIRLVDTASAEGQTWRYEMF